MKKSIKIVSIVLMILAMVLIAIPVFAKTELNYTPNEVKMYESDATKNVQDIGGDVLGVIRTVGTIVAVGMIIILGIKYMMGSAEERAEYKKTLFPYFVGAILIFAASTLADMIYGWVN